MQFEQLDGGLVLARMDEGKANAIGFAFLDALDALLDEVLAVEARALILTGSGKHFSAGLNLSELHAIDVPRMGAFVDEFERVQLRLFELPLPVVAAINGNAVAGGCVMAAECDHRVAAAGDYRIGINEIGVGVTLPSIALEAMRCLLSAPALRTTALGGGLVAPDGALALGLIDEIVAPDVLLARASAVAREFMRVPTAAFAQIKRELRAPYSERVRTAGAASRRAFVELWFSPEASARRARFA